MNILGSSRCGKAVLMIAVGLTSGFMGLAGWPVELQAQSARQSETLQPPPAIIADSEARLLWQEQMNSASEALGRKSFAEAELDCAEALKTIKSAGSAAGCLTTNLVLMGEIYQAENKFALAEQAFQAAVTNLDKAAGPDDPRLVMPLEKLANFYYFAEHRYEQATPLCLKILQLVKNTSPQDPAEVKKRTLAVAVIYRLQNDFAHAEPFYQQVLDLTAKAGEDVPGAMLAVADFYHDWEKFDQAESLCRRALAWQEQAAAGNTNLQGQTDLAVTLYALAENYRHWGELNQAEPLYRRSMEIVEKTAGPDNSDLPRPLSGLAATLAAQGQTNEATALYQRAYAIAKQNLEPEDPMVKAILDDYAALLDKMNRTAEANALRQDHQWEVLINHSQRARKVNALEAAEKFTAEAFNIATNFGATDPRRARSQVQMAEIYRQQGKIELAEQTYQKAIADYGKAVGTNNPDLIMPLESQADFYYTTKIQPDQVALIYRRILSILQSEPAPEPLEIAHWQRNLADVYRLEGQVILAEKGYQQALTSVETITNATDDQVQYLQLLADFYRTGGRYEEAERMARRALSLRERAAESDAGPDAQLGLAICDDSLAENYLVWNKPAQAELFFNRSLAIVEKIAGGDSSDLTSRLLGLARALRAQKKYAAAEARYKQALAITEKNFGSEATEVADVLDQYAALLTETAKPEDAQGMRAWADSIRRSNAPRPDSVPPNP